MGQGQGSITSNQKREAAGSPAPPFALNSAFNGLSVDTVTGQIVLGQDFGAAGNPANLVSNREIPLNGFAYRIGTGNTRFFISEPANLVDITTGSFQIDEGGFLMQRMNQAIGQYQFGDISGFNNNTNIDLQDSTQIVTVSSGLLDGLKLDFGSGVYQMGDVNGIGNSWVLYVDDFNGEAAMGDTFGASTGVSFYISRSGPTYQMYDNGGDYFLIANSNLGISPRDYKFGDISMQNNGTTFAMDDSLQTIAILSGGLPQLGIDVVNGIYSMGDISSAVNGTYFNIDDGNSVATIQNQGGLMLELDRVAGIYRIGDISSIGNNCNLEIDDTNQRIRIRTSAGVHFDIAAGGITQIALAAVPGNNMIVAQEGGGFRDISIGDVSGAGGNTVLAVNDITNRVFTRGFNQIIGTATAYANNAAAAAGTLLNAPIAGNPSKWIPINDNGTIRNIPAW